MNTDRIHARKPSRHPDRWTAGTIQAIEMREGHCVVTVAPEAGGTKALVVTTAIRDLFLRRLRIEADESPVGERVWYRQHGAGASGEDGRVESNAGEASHGEGDDS
jgi:hypothetical protein